MKFSKSICSLALAAISLASAWAQAPQKADIRCAENRVIYELFTRNFSQDSKFTSVTAQLDRLQALGVDVIWMMPIQQLGDRGKWGTYSSPYAIKDYYNVDPMYGTNADFQALVNAAHARGMEVWLDWVGNHTSLDAVWTSTHPEYYGDDGGQQGFFNPSGWADVYNLNYNRADTREATANAMAHWVNTYNVDGFRLDNTEGVSDDHWRMIKQVVESKISRQITWLAETGEDHIVQNGVFDCNYAWGYGDYLRNNGQNPSVQGLKDWSSGLHNLNIYKGKNRMVYLTNHDVQQDAGGTEDKWFGDNLKPFTVLEFTIYGMPLIYNGQEVKYSHYDKIMLSEKNVINWNGDASMTQLITDLCHLKHTEPALRCFSQAGELINYNASNGNVYVYERRRGSYSVVVMLNFNGNQTNFTVNGLPSASYIDYFNQAAGYKNLATAGSFSLPARGYAVFIKNDDGSVVEPDPQPDTYNTVTFIRPDGWNNTPNVHIYYPKEAWGGSDDVTFVNSQPMTDDGNNTFTYRVKNLSDRYNIMFNNGGWDNGSSPSLYEESRGDYTYALQGGELVHYNGGGQGNTEPQPDPQPSTHTVAISGDINSWSDSANSVTAAGNPEIIFDSWTNGEWGFKIEIDGNWYSMNTNNLAADGTWHTNMVSAEGMGKNMWLTTSAEGKKVKFTINPVDRSFKAEIITESIPQPQPTSYTIRFDNGLTEWEPLYAYVWGGNGHDDGTENANWPGELLTQKDGTVYTYTFDAAWTPDHVIFNNGTDNGKTADLDFINNHTYGDPKPAPKVCETPVISISGNKLRVTCATSGAQLHTNVSAADHGLTDHASGAEIDLTGQYLITSYATAAGFEDSPAATASFVWVKNYNLPSHQDMIDGEMGRAVIVKTVGDNIVVEGTTYGEPIELYELSGYCIFRGIANAEPFTIPAGLIKGEIYILTIGSTAVKHIF